MQANQAGADAAARRLSDPSAVSLTAVERQLEGLEGKIPDAAVLGTLSEQLHHAGLEPGDIDRSLARATEGRWRDFYRDLGTFGLGISTIGTLCYTVVQFLARDSADVISQTFAAGRYMPAGWATEQAAENLAPAAGELVGMVALPVASLAFIYDGLRAAGEALEAGADCRGGGHRPQIPTRSPRHR